MSTRDYTPPIAGGPFTPHQTCEIHKQLIEASLAIGGIAELAQWASMALAEHIAAKHGSINKMTVGELSQMGGGASL